MVDSIGYDPLTTVMERLAQSAGLSYDDIQRDPLNGANRMRLYDSIMRQPGSESAVRRDLIDDITQNIVRDQRFLFNPNDFERSDHYELTDFFTSRLRSKFKSFRQWVYHDSFPDDVEIISFPSSQPFAYIHKYKDAYRIVIHYGLSQLLEFAEETFVVQRWLNDLRKKEALFGRDAVALIDSRLDEFLDRKLALGVYVQTRPLLLPGLAAGLPTPYLLELMSSVAFAELFVCAHEHVHITEGHFRRGRHDDLKYHGFAIRGGTSLTEDQQLEMATDVKALSYFDGRGLQGALDGVSLYFLVLSAFHVLFAAPSRNHPPILARIDNLLAESVAIGGRGVFPATLFKTKEVLKGMEERDGERADLDNFRDWPNLIAAYRDMAQELGRLLTLTDILQRRASGSEKSEGDMLPVASSRRANSEKDLADNDRQRGKGWKTVCRWFGRRWGSKD